MPPSRLEKKAVCVRCIPTALDRPSLDFQPDRRASTLILQFKKPAPFRQGRFVESRAFETQRIIRGGDRLKAMPATMLLTQISLLCYYHYK
jgi:hypothetical protein